MSKNKKISHFKHQSSSSIFSALSANKPPVTEPLRPVGTKKPACFFKGGSLSFDASSAPSTTKGRVSFVGLRSEKEHKHATTPSIDCNTGNIAHNSASSGSSGPSPINDKPKPHSAREEGVLSSQRDVHQVQDGVQLVLPAIPLEAALPPQESSDPRVDGEPALKDELARVLAELEKARREISVKAANEKALADQINQHATKIEQLTKEKEIAVNELRELRHRFDGYKADANDNHNRQTFQSKSRRLAEEIHEAKEYLKGLGVKVDDPSEGLCDLIRTYRRQVDGQIKWDQECIDQLNGRLVSSDSRLAASLQQGQNSLSLAETYRINNDRLVKKNNDLERRLIHLEYNSQRQSDSDRAKYKKILNQNISLQEEIERLSNEKQAVIDMLERQSDSDQAKYNEMLNQNMSLQEEIERLYDENQSVNDLLDEKKAEALGYRLQSLSARITALKLVILGVFNGLTEKDIIRLEKELFRTIEKLDLALAKPNLVADCPECFEDEPLEEWQASIHAARGVLERSRSRRFWAMRNRARPAKADETTIPPPSRANGFRNSSNPRSC